MAAQGILRRVPKSSRARSRRLWVVKVGSSVLTEGGPLLLRAWMQQVAALRDQHQIQVIWVSSGAIATARGRIRRMWTRLPEKQALSAIGQSILMENYNLAINSIGSLAGQVLLTYDDIRHPSRRRNLKNTLNTLLEWNVTPILNENDAVATEEIQFGDNDTLSAMVASLMKAEKLVIMTNVEGLYERNSPSKIIRSVSSVTAALLAQVDHKKKSLGGTGGMYSKLLAARMAQRAGIGTVLMRGDTHHGLLKIAQGEQIGTSINGK